VSPQAKDHQVTPQSTALHEALGRQADGDDHDRSLIVERLAWTPQERLDANTAFLRFYYAVRPGGPIVGDD
jgi:hypothetical protein